MTLTSLMRFKGPQHLGGCIALSGIISYDKLCEEKSLEDAQRVHDTPLFLYIGSNDTHFPVPIALATY